MQITTDVVQIKKEAEEMLENLHKPRDELEKDYPILLSSSKTLFQLILNNKNFDKKILNSMFDKIIMIQNNRSTQEKESENIGQELFDKFIDPVVKK